MLDTKALKRAEKIYIVLPKALGDLIACEPIPRYLKRLNPNAKIIWVADKSYQEFLSANPNVDTVETVSSWGDAFEFIKKHPDEIIVDCCYDEKICPLTSAVHQNNNRPDINEKTYYDNGTLLETFSMVAGLPALKEGPVFYNIKEVENLPEKYVVFHPLSSEACRCWEQQKWQALAEELFKKDIHIVELGYENQVISDSPFYHNFTHKRDLFEIADIIQKASLFVGVDSGFAHIANAVQTKSVILLGRYRNFICPMPYNGFFEKNATLLYAQNNSTVKDLTPEEVLSAIFDTGIF